ncbi:hypothetical protein WJX77_006924 [Trebouxia sp. C0004]
MVPIYDDGPTDSELTKQAERLAALEAEAKANIFHQKLSYARPQLHGSVGKEPLGEPGRAGHNTLWGTDSSPIPQAANT